MYKHTITQSSLSYPNDLIMETNIKHVSFVHIYILQKFTQIGEKTENKRLFLSYILYSYFRMNFEHHQVILFYCTYDLKIKILIIVVVSDLSK